MSTSDFPTDHTPEQAGPRNDRQAIILRSGGADGIIGTYKIGFNGRVTHELTMYASAQGECLSRLLPRFKRLPVAPDGSRWLLLIQTHAVC